MKIPEHYECDICGKYIEPWENYVTITPRVIDRALTSSRKPKEFCMSCWDDLVKELKERVKDNGKMD